MTHDEALIALEEVRKVTFGDVGDEPDIFSDYDLAVATAGKFRDALTALNAEPAAPVVAPLTLDDVTRHTDALCAEYRQRMVDHQAWYTERVGQLSAAIEASEGLNHMEAGYIFLTKIRELTAPPETVTPEPVPVAEWVDWSGGDRPIPGDTLISVKFRDGTEADGYARDILWEHTAIPFDIMAYRVNA